jgi:hypothetical protein
MRCMVLCGLLAIGCGDSTPANPDLGVADMRIPADMTILVSPLGGTCTGDEQCTDGKTPVCFKKTLFNSPGKLTTREGYCSSKCTDDNDCGGDGICADFGTSGKWCLRYCERASECRSVGYACFRGGYCFPDGNLDCDPTFQDGRCDSAVNNNPGACRRAAWGSGIKGYCEDGCQIGPAACPPDSDGDRMCNVLDYRNLRDNDNQPTGDKFFGPTCVSLYAMNPVGTYCKDTNSSSRYINACVDNAECYIAGYFPGGDNLCKQLCTGAVDVDGGAPPCPGGTTCTDVWKLLGTAYPAGLCL